MAVNKREKLSTALKRRAINFLAEFPQPQVTSYQHAGDILNEVVCGASGKGINEEDNVMFLFAYALSGKALPKYATLDFTHICEINAVLAIIKHYSEDASQKRPLNFLMLASPGAGKSHFIRCMAERLEAQNVKPIIYNMVGFQRNEDLIPMVLT
jgi:chromosomal replication initiation ATPase DnaA